VRLGKNIITRFVKEYLVSRMPSIKNENKRVEKFQMTGVVLGKKKIQKPVIVFDDT